MGGGEDGCHISQEGDEGERRKVKRKDEVRVGVRGGQKEKDRRAWEGVASFRTSLIRAHDPK